MSNSSIAQKVFLEFKERKREEVEKIIIFVPLFMFGSLRGKEKLLREIKIDEIFVHTFFMFLYSFIFSLLLLIYLLFSFIFVYKIEQEKCIFILISFLFLFKAKQTFFKRKKRKEKKRKGKREYKKSFVKNT